MNLRSSMKIRNKNLLTRSVLFGGYYCYSNTGDDAFCAISAWGARHYWKAEKILFLCEQLPVLPVPARAVLAEHKRFPGQRLIQSVAALAKKPIIIFAGGSVFHKEVNIFESQSLVGKCQRIWPSIVGAIGVSLGPFRSSQARKRVEKFLSRFSFLILRDHRSYEEACSMNLPFEPVEGFDLAALLPELYGLAKRSDNSDSDKPPILGVSICHYERYVGGDVSNEERREKRIAETLKIVSQNIPVTIRFLVFNGSELYGETKLTEKIAALIGNYAKTEIIPYSPAPAVMWRKMGECRGVLATRLHAGIFSCVAGVPFLQVEYHQKCVDFLEDIGYSMRWRIGDMDVPPTEAALILVDMIDKQTRPFSVDSAKLREKAERNFTEVDFSLGNQK